MPKYTLTVTVPGTPAEVEERVRGALAEEGFGVLTEIDVQATLKAKLDVDLEPYKILGACNPPLAHKAIQRDPDVGALLPCNVVVRGSDGETVVQAIDPEAMLGVADGLDEIAGDVRERLERALRRVAGR